MTGFAAFVVFGVAMVLHPIVLSDLWRWFVVPLGAPRIGAIHAWGLQLALCYFSMTSHIYSGMSENKDRDFLERSIGLLSTVLSVWGIGWVLSHWVSVGR